MPDIKQERRSRDYFNENIETQVRNDRADLMRLAQIYLITVRCKKCGHVAHSQYCCWNCGNGE